MKKNCFYLLTALLVAMVSFGLTACGDDDDDDNGGGGSGGSGNAALIINGKSYALSHAWYKVGHKTLYLAFANMDVYGFRWEGSKNDIQYQFLDFTISNYEGSDVQEGKYTASMEFEDLIVNYSKQSRMCQTDVAGKVEVNITKDGNNYIITVPETNVNLYDDETDEIIGTTPFSFLYTGKLAIKPVEEDD